MNWTRQNATTQDMLERIVALLVALADLAERAAGAPDARRRLALAILQSGEAITRDAFCVAHTAHRQAAPAGLIPGDGPEDALDLAMSLRTLALLVAVLARHQRRLAALMSGHARVTGYVQGCIHRRHDEEIDPATVPPLPWHDTS